MSKNIQRCDWGTRGGKLMERYHDKEWGVPLYNDRKIFEFLVLESAQAGLSWLIVLRKREGYKKAFANFDPQKVARFTARDIARLVKNPEIIRNRAKIEAAVNNAKRFLEIRKEFGTFSKYAWQFVNNKPIVKDRKSMSDLPAKTNEAELWAKDLKKRGFKFLGATVIYAHMQASGMVNDHVVNCFRFKEVVQR
jgi:DNA-3-methyladenine glycosylase I